MSDFDKQFLKNLKEIKKKRRKYYWNDSIQSQDKDNMINLKRNKLNPSIIINNKIKRVGINKIRGKFTADDDFNQMNK